ncbi:YceI family protein [Mycolicibacterium arseniciresistens]|uniref:YceI family protein n=1 Tax=Mycolicibacterium arseniciresistens TaxID=3062257 RepID=A0ABT8U9K9_9MYCO|nr:YceI family protein [Mycolicibacterium arseniciresistens]MDO3634477.1 YceI family protein [Mycolicibacterium arseniciresistens]
MTTAEWMMDASHGELLVTTGVTGPAAKMGHRLTLAMTSWQAIVRTSSDEPVSVEVTVDVDSLEVLRGEGGVKGLSGPEKMLARSNALGVFDAKMFPTITFRADDVAPADGGYQFTGTLEIHGVARERTVDVQVSDAGDSWRIACDAEVRHSDFQMKPYSMVMGAMKVEDAVAVSFNAQVAKD